MYPRDNIFKIYYQIGRALPFEVRRFPDGRVSDWYKSQSVIVTKIHPRKEYGDAWGYYYRNGKREDSYWCKKRILNPKPFLAADVVDGFLLMLLDNQLLNRRNPLKN